MSGQDERVGISGYLSESLGIGGIIKDEPGDFLVEEITPEGRVLEVGSAMEFEPGEGDYTYFTLQKNNWDTMRAVKAISKACNVSHKRFKFAGTKDRRAITVQRVSAWKVSIEQLQKIKIKDLELRDFCHGEEPINLGTLKGNRFTILIRGVEKDADKKVDRIVDELKGGFPNFFGQQRFGNRLNNHDVGREILRGNFKEAVMIYLSDGEGEPEEARKARGRIRGGKAWKQALKEFPDYLGYEKSVLNHLAQYDTDYIGALRELPKKLRWIFVHAYQGYIFNIALSGCIEKGRIPKELPLVGYESKLGKVTKKLLECDGISREQFNVASMPEMSSKGELRQCLSKFKDFGIFDFNEGDSNIRVKFELPPGSYATMLLRELMKS
jgi:tRNA pseudouridine13 synthase